MRWTSRLRCWPLKRYPQATFYVERSDQMYLIAGLRHALIERSYRTLFTRTDELVQRL